MLRRIGRDQARLGMYVHAFDGSWLRHPFWRPHFALSSPELLERLLDSEIPSLVIDEGRGVPLTPDAPPEPSPASRVGTSRRTACPTAAPPPSPPERPCAFDEERVRAAKIAARSKRVVQGVLEGARAGLGVRAADVADAAEEIAASVRRHPQALIGLTRLRSKDEYTYVHSVAVSALIVNFARHLGLSPQDARELGVAGLLHDVGKMVVPGRILHKPGALTEEELALVRTHPEQGYRLLTEGEGMSDIALDVARHHHERMDGGGYPLRLRGDEISLHARIAAICDVYDALTSRRPYKEAWTPAEAIGRMRGWEGHFDPALLFRFMGSVGVYPVGMLVRLRSNRLGVVMDNGRRASKPRVNAFHSTRDRAAMPPEVVVIDDSLAADQILGEERPDDWGLENWHALRDALSGETRRGAGRKAA